MKIQRTIAICSASAILAASLMAQDAPKTAEDERPAWLPSIELSIDHTSRYMSEGNVGNPDPINTIGLTAEYGITDSFAAHIGGVAIVDETDACENEHNVEEWDWIAGFTWTIADIDAIGDIEINFDYIYYNYPRDGAHTHDADTKEYEIDVNATKLFLSPGIAFVHDFENDVIKANANVTYEIDLASVLENLSFECPVELWVGNHQYTGCTSSSAVYSVCAQPTLKYAINEKISVSTFVQMGWALDSRVRRDWRDDENNNEFNACWGINFTASF